MKKPDDQTTCILREYTATDGVGGMSVFALAIPPAEFDRLRAEFLDFANGNAESLPRVEQQDHGDLSHGFCYNHEWLAFMKWLLEKGIQIEQIHYAQKGSTLRDENRRMAAMDRNDAMTRQDVATQGELELAEGAGYFHVVVRDYASGEQFESV